MKQILRFKWYVAALVLVITVALFLAAPNLTEQAEDAGNFQLPEDADSEIAAKILEEAGANDETISIVYDLENPLQEDNRQSITETLEKIEAMGEPVDEVLNPFESEETEDQLVSEDEQTILLPITVSGSSEEINELADTIQSDILANEEMTSYVTGETIIDQDVNESSQEGLERTEVITVVLIFVLLLAVFRSIVTPIIPLVAVGVTYLLSQSIVSFFIDWFGFPVSNYTQIFLVAVLFGIGTDYCILLLSRYKEELTNGHTTETAIINTYKTAGRTLFISGAAVFIGFSAIGFAEFPIFKSSVGVAVGIAVLLIVLYTLVPFFMAILKDKLFWPAKNSASHKDSKMWTWMSKFSVLRPIRSLLVVAVITVPFLLTYDGDLSFNTVDEIGNGYDSVKGLNAIEEGFGQGESLPLNIIIKDEKDIVTEDTTPYLESLSKEILKNEHVDAVRTVTRPTGEVIEDLYADTQLQQIANGLADMRDGIDETQSGLGEIQSQLESISNELPSSSTEEVGGLSEASAGLGQINQQLGAISQGMQQSQDVNQAAEQLAQVQGQLSQIEQSLSGASSQIEGQASQISELKNGLSELANGVGSSIDGLEEIKSGLDESTNLLSGMGDSDSIRDTGVYIPEGTLENEDFQPALDRYAFGEQSGILLEVILKDNPYSPEAIETTTAIKEAVENEVIGTPLEDMTIAYNGVSSINEELSDIAQSDFTRSVVIMLIGLFIVLTILFRSMIMPLYMIGSLLLTYYTSLSIAELIFVNGLGYDGITWAVPFFGFVMLVALGVDYSIFLLDRFNEEAKVSLEGAMMKSMSKMGTVVITAAIILAGTFGAMMPSGVLSLVQIATIVITGLLLYGLIILPLLIPAITVSFGKGVWWPFKQK
ncbi:MMPL family transporter [Halobacillus seohaensis]|uniref:MMPL family transporter n=1 Tax=Halobacillus seohaensis TaxID=447421 RepID=A0ABW2ERU2_9BACI